MEQKIYKDNRIWTGTMIGGPLAAGFFLYSNFKIFNKSNAAIISLISSFVITLILLFFIPELPESIPNIFIPFLYTGVTHCIVRYTQQKDIDKHIEEDRKIYSWGKTIIVSVICLVITGCMFFIPSGIKYYQAKTIINKLGSVPKFKNEVNNKKYGIQEIYFDKNISEETIDEFSKTLYDLEIFNDKIKVFVFISNDNDTYNFYFNSILFGSNMFEKYEEMKKVLNKKIRFRFFDNNLENIGIEMKNDK